MATVTREFKANFDAWAADRISRGEFSESDMEELKGLLRKDLQPGPDQLRQGLMHINEAGIERPTMIDDRDERYRLWENYFADEVRAIGARV